MTSTIDSPSTPVQDQGVAITPMLMPFSDVAPSLFALWTLPLCSFQMWAHGWATVLGAHEPEADIGDEAQELPVPNTHQAAKDHELFA